MPFRDRLVGDRLERAVVDETGKGEPVPDLLRPVPARFDHALVRPIGDEALGVASSQSRHEVSIELDIDLPALTDRDRELGLVTVVRGRAGGVSISDTGRTVTVGWLLRRLDTRTDVAACESPNGPCPLLAGCGLRGALSRAREAFYGELDDLVIATLLHSRGSGPVLVGLTTGPA